MTATVRLRSGEESTLANLKIAAGKELALVLVPFHLLSTLRNLIVNDLDF
jgi:hypothetical protein